MITAKDIAIPWNYYVTLVSLLFSGSLVAAEMRVCHDYGCKQSSHIRLTSHELQQVQQLFHPSLSTPSEEREQIANAIALLEKYTARHIGSEDLAENYAGIGLPKQMDCIDESYNTQRYLQLLEQQQLLIWHRTSSRVYRSPWLFDQHWSASIEERHQGTRYAVDSWFLDNGKRPYIQPLTQWRKKAPLPFNPDAPSK